MLKNRSFFLALLVVGAALLVACDSRSEKKEGSPLLLEQPAATSASADNMPVDKVPADALTADTPEQAASADPMEGAEEQSPPPDIDKAPEFLPYQCESRHKVEAAYYLESDMALVRYQGREYQLNQEAAASGTRYTGAGLEWRAKGSGPGSLGMLSRLDGASGESILESCVQVGEEAK